MLGYGIYLLVGVKQTGGIISVALLTSITVVGFLLFLVGFLGCLGACCNNTCMLITVISHFLLRLHHLIVRRCGWALATCGNSMWGASSRESKWRKIDYSFNLLSFISLLKCLGINWGNLFMNMKIILFPTMTQLNFFI